MQNKTVHAEKNNACRIQQSMQNKTFHAEKTMHAESNSPGRKNNACRIKQSMQNITIHAEKNSPRRKTMHAE